MADAPAPLDVDRGLCIVLTVVSGAAVFAADALHGDASGRTAGPRPHLSAAAAPTARGDIGIEIVIEDRDPPDVSCDERALETAVEVAATGPAKPLFAFAAPTSPRFAQEVKRASRSSETLIATTLATIRANASTVEPASSGARAMK
jgi:hypothetical protein